MSEYSTPELKPDFLSRPLLATLNIDWEKTIYIILLILAIVTRFYGLGDRVMSHDESLHTQFSYQFYNGDGYNHTPLMHGPFLFHITSVSYWLFGHNDLTARIPVALFGVLLVLMPYFFRSWIGKVGALFTSFLFLISPFITYYSRYIRHDIYVIVWAMIVFLAIWYYLRERKEKYLWWFAGGTALMFSTKEVSFIYVAIFGGFLIIRLLPQILTAPWLKNNLNKLKTPLLLIILGGIIAGGGFLGQRFAVEEDVATPEALETFAADPETDTQLSEAGEQSRPELLLGWVQIAGIAVLSGGLFLAARSMRPYIDQYAEFDLIMLFTTLILPSVSPVLVTLAGGNPRDYTVNRCVLEGTESLSPLQQLMARFGNGECWNAVINSPIMLTAVFLIITLVISVLLGLWWGRRRWLIAAAIFHGIFAVLFTSLFTNPGGWTSGIIGSLAYWLEQQDVQRGNQPLFYYFFVVPFYEFLPLIFSLLAIRLWAAQRRLNRLIGYWLALILIALLAYSLSNWALNISNIRAGLPSSTLYGTIISLLILGAGFLYWFLRRQHQLRAQYGDIESLSSLFPQALFSDMVPALIWWLILTWGAYSWAGEKMPWLSTHFVIPMAILSGWYFNEKFKTFSWEELRTRRTWQFIGLTLVLIFAILVALGPIFLGQVQLGGQTQQDLQTIGQVLGGVIAAGVVFWLWQQLAEGVEAGLRRFLWAVSIFTLLSLLTIRFTYMSSFPNADYAKEFMVYAHGAPAAKSIVMDQIETLSLRQHGDLSLKVAFGGSGVSWPFTWYMRDYANRLYFGENPSATLNEYDVVIVGRSSWDQVDQILGRNYTYNTYTYLWWPMEQYRNINWNALFGDPLLPEGVERHGLLNTSVRQALWDVFFYRDFNKYGQTFGGTFTDSTWPLRDELRLYIRKDTLVNLWDYGIDGISAAGLEIPYEAGEIILEPALVINETGFASGEETGFYAPRNVAVTADGRIYILDSGNQRVQVYSPDGVLLNSFGGPGNGPGQMAPGEFGQELQGPWGIAISEEFVFVADTWNHRILKFSLEGQFLAAFGQNGDIGSDPLGGGLGIFFGPRGLVNVGNELLAITDTGHHRIQIMDFNGNFLAQVGNNGEFGAALGQFYEPVGIAAGPDGSVYVTDTWNGRMQQLTGDLFPLRDWDMETNWAGNFSLNNKPYVAVDSGGRVFVTDPEDSRVLIFNADGSYLARFGTFGTDTRSFNLPTGIFIDTQDNIYIADAGNNRVIKYNAIYPPAVPLEPVPEEPVEEEPVEEEPVEAPAEEEMEEAVDPSPTP